MTIDLNNPNEFTLANVRQLIASGDVTKAMQLRVSSRGWVQLVSLNEGEKTEDLAFQFSPWLPKDERVGAQAAADDQWVLRIYVLLRDNWPDPSSKFIDTRQS